MADLNKQKRQLRQAIRQQRKAITAEQKEIASAQLADRLLQLPHFQTAQSFAAYLAMPEEIDTQPLLASALKLGKKCYLPVLHATETQPMQFAPYTLETPLQANQYGILEPLYDEHTLCPPESLDLILMPLVAFDIHGNRLGMGKGYYDRTLATLPSRNSTYLIGLAFECQCVSHVPHDQNDVKLSAVVTEQMIHTI